ncbi:MAG: OPT/YSL family transporter [Candidatus Bathyarchaeota archaeon]
MKSEESAVTTQKTVESGSPLTWRSLSGIWYASVVLLPAVIWLYFATGSLLAAGTAMYTTALVFGELARLSKPLTKQEIFIIMFGSTTAANFVLAPGLIYRVFFQSSPITRQFGLTESIPSWLVPAANSPAIMQRNLLHPDWIVPIVVTLTVLLLAKASGIALGFLFRYLYVEVEKLPFPMQQVQAEICNTMAVKESNKIRLFTFSTLLSMAYGALLWALPIITHAILGRAIFVIPQPWIDFSGWVGAILPGATFGIATTLTVFAMGLILPLKVVLGMFVGSLSFYFVGNAVLVNLGLFVDWFPGMGISDAWQRSILNFWASPMIGLILASVMLPIIRHPKNLLKTFSDLLKVPTVARKQKSISLKLIVPIFLLSTLASVLMVWILVPGFRNWVWILVLLSVGWTFVFSMISTRAIGVTGMGPVAPFSGSLFVQEGAYIATGYAGVDIWFAPLIVDSGGAIFCATFKTAELTDTNPMDFVKAYFIAFFSALIMDFIYTWAFWRITPIPSALFPVPTWPLQAAVQGLFITRSFQLFQPSLMIGAAAVGSVLFLVIELAHLPISLIGIALGPTLPIPYTVTYMIGAVAAYMLEKRKGKTWFYTYRTVIVAGIFTGIGFAVAVGTGIALIAQSMWATPY